MSETKALHLDFFAAVALREALDNYMNGQGMTPGDNDEWMLQAIVSDLWRIT